MTYPTDEPAVLTWMIALAGDRRPKAEPTGRHWWRELVTDTWRNATLAWERELEATAIGYATEEAEFREKNPPPRLGDAMRALSRGQIEPGRAA